MAERYAFSDSNSYLLTSIFSFYAFSLMTACNS